jgi:Na+/proline symporter
MFMRCLGRGLYYASAVIWLFAALCVVARPAYAYVDPGSGFLMLQIVSSTFVGITFLIRKRIREVFRRFGKTTQKATEDVESH